jgi:hypothetical protein
MSSRRQWLSGQEMTVSCYRCEELERRCQLVLDRIHWTAGRRFNTVAEKLDELFRLQDRRDEIAAELHAHKRVHVRETYKRKAAGATEISDVLSWIDLAI